MLGAKTRQKPSRSYFRTTKKKRRKEKHLQNQPQAINPQIKHELEKKDLDLMKKTGQKGSAQGGDSWVWLLSDSGKRSAKITII